MLNQGWWNVNKTNLFCWRMLYILFIIRVLQLLRKKINTFITSDRSRKVLRRCLSSMSSKLRELLPWYIRKYAEITNHQRYCRFTNIYEDTVVVAFISSVIWNKLYEHAHLSSRRGARYPVRIFCYLSHLCISCS